MGSLERRILRGDHPFAGTLGREGIFVVHAAHAASAEWVGKRVAVEAFVACGNCDLCRSGLRRLCTNRSVPGVYNADGYASSLALARAASLVEVPATLPVDSALIAQTFAAALHAVQTARVDTRGFVTILGDGAIALLAAQIASTMNPHVRLLGKHPDRFTLCERIGIKHRHVAEVGKRHDQAVVIDCTGDTSEDGFSFACALAAPRARIVVKATPFPPAANTPARAPIAAAAAIEATVCGAGAGQVRDAFNFMLKHRVDAGLIISRRATFARAADTLDTLHDRRVITCCLEMPAD
jgi:threonine dehydrogenase-like Zn-dependent dehydrogenase